MVAPGRGQGCPEAEVAEGECRGVMGPGGSVESCEIQESKGGICKSHNGESKWQLLSSRGATGHMLMVVLRVTENVFVLISESHLQVAIN